MQKKILFRADAMPGIGAGDLTSLITLSKYFEHKGWECHFIAKKTTASQNLFVGREIKNPTYIEKDVSIEDEVSAINSYILHNNIDSIFFCITNRNLSDYASISKSVYTACVCINDNIMPDANLLVAWDPRVIAHFDKSKYPSAHFLFGMQYVILPMEYLQEAHRNHTRSDDLLVTFGGVDEYNLTHSIIQVLHNNRINLHVRIILGAGYSYSDDLMQFLKNSSLNYHIISATNSIFNELFTCKAAICSGGMTVYETVATGTPAAVVAAVEHQVPRCDLFHAAGAITFLGLRSFDEKELVNFILNPPAPQGNFLFRPFDIVDTIEKHIGVCNV